MGRKGYQGLSATDRSINVMDRFIKKSDKKKKLDDNGKPLPIRRKSSDIPIELWPLKDQIEYWDNLGPAGWFDVKYEAYTDWYLELSDITGYPVIAIRDMVAQDPNNRQRIKSLYENKIRPIEAYRILVAENVLWV